MTLHPHILLGANLLFPFSKMHIIYMDLHTAFLVPSLYFGTQVVLVV